MIVKIDPSCLRQTRWYDLALRFLLGGIITAATGLIARGFGPAVGGLFLAFPAIFPASCTLVEKHEREKKQRKGLTGTRRGRNAAALEAKGAALGSLGLLVFAALVWLLIRGHGTPLVLIVATLAWLIASAGIWTIQKRY